MMRQKTLLLFATLFVAASFPAPGRKPTDTEAPLTIRALYFHPAERCAGCRAMEGFTRAALDQNFADAVADKTMKMESLELQAPENKPYIEDFNLIAGALVIEARRDGKRIAWKNLDKIWDYSADEKGYIAYVSGEIRDLMKQAGSSAKEAKPAGADQAPEDALPRAELRWKTESEEDNFGFYIERSMNPEGPFERITKKIIAGHGTTNIPHNYEFVDYDVEVGKTYHYRLYSFSYQGKKELMGTIRHTVKAPDASSDTAEQGE